MSGPEPQPPQVTLSCDPSPIAVGDTITCTASLTGDPADTLEWAIPEGTPAFGGITFNTPAVSPDSDTITVEACNIAGCNEASDSVTVAIPPKIGLSCDPSPVATNAEVTCTAALIEGTLPVSVWWRTSISSVQTDNLEFKTTFSDAGLQPVMAEVRNIVGQSIDDTPIEVIPPPLLTLSCPSTVNVDAQVNCTVSNSGGEVASYDWDTLEGPVNTTEPSLRLSFGTPAQEQIRVQGCNIVDVCDSDATTVSVVPGVAPPQISISCSPLFVAPGQLISCPASIITGPVDSITWRTSDDPSLIGPSPFMTSFTTEGEKWVEATACNSGGCRNSNRVTIWVTTATLAVSPSPLTFEDPCTYEGGSLISCPDSVSQPVTLKNVGEGQLSITSTSIGGPDHSHFSVDSSDCDSPLAAGETCEAVVTFSAPHTAGSVSAALTIEHTGANTPTSVDIRAQGSPPLMTIESFDVSFSGDCFCDDQMWLDITFLVKGDIAGEIQLWRKKIGHSWQQVGGDFAVDEINQFQLSQDDDQTWKYRLFATNSVGESAVPETRMLEGANQCLVVE